MANRKIQLIALTKDSWNHPYGSDNKPYTMECLEKAILCQLTILRAMGFFAPPTVLRNMAIHNVLKSGGSSPASGSLNPKDVMSLYTGSSFPVFGTYLDYLKHYKNSLSVNGRKAHGSGIGGFYPCTTSLKPPVIDTKSSHVLTMARGKLTFKNTSIKQAYLSYIKGDGTCDDLLIEPSETVDIEVLFPYTSSTTKYDSFLYCKKSMDLTGFVDDLHVMADDSLHEGCGSASVYVLEPQVVGMSRPLQTYELSSSYSVYTTGTDITYSASRDIFSNPKFYNSALNMLLLPNVPENILLSQENIDWEATLNQEEEPIQITRFGTLYTGGQKRPMATKPWRTDNQLAPDVPQLGDIPQHSSGQEITIRNSESGDYKNNIPWVKVTHPTTLKDLYIASQNLLVNVSWQELDAQDLIFGKQVEIDGKKYKLRCIEGGISPRVAGQNYDGANPTTNEWDMFVWNEAKLAGFPDPDPVNLNYTLGAMDLKTSKGTPHAKLWNWGGCHSWCLNQANYQTGAEQSIKTVRGYHTPNYFNVQQPYLKGFQIGWRPVLEPLTVDMQPYIKVVDANRLNITWKVVGVEQGITKATAELNGVEIMNKTTGVYGFMTHIINASQLLSTPNTLVIKYSNVDNVVVAEKTIKINKGVGRIPPAQTFATIGGYRVKITEALSDSHLLHLTLNTDLSKKVKSGDLVELMYNDFRPQCAISDDPITAPAFSEMQHFKTRHLGNSIFEDCYTLKALGRYVAFKDIIIKDTQSPNPYLKDFQASFRYSSQ